MKSFWLYALATFGLLSGVSLPTAQAGVMNFNFNSVGTHDVSGALTYNDAPNALPGGNGHDITGISGFVVGSGGGTIASLITNPNQPNPYSSSGYTIDNVLFSTGPLLDVWGVFFTTTNGSIWNLWGNGNNDYELHSHMARVDEHGTLTAEIVQQQQHGVPEPQSLALLGLGLVGMTFIRRRQQQPKMATATMGT